MNVQAVSLITSGLYLIAAATWFAGYRRGASFKSVVIGTFILLLAGLDRASWTSFEIADQVRQVAQEQGWYHRRRFFQIPVTIFLAMLAVSQLLYAMVPYRKEMGSGVSLKFASLVTLLAFYFIRVLSNHTVDYWFFKTIAGIQIHWMIEWSLLMAIIYFSRRECSTPR